MIEDLFRTYYRPLCLYALHFTEDIDAAEDIVQECFLKWWQSDGRGGKIGNVRAYLYASVRNACLDRARREAVLGHEIPDIAEEPLEEDSFREAWLWTAVGKLPEKRREMLLMRGRDGLKYEEIAERMGLSVNTVRNQISRALKTLKSAGKKILMFFLT